jgi:ABC-type branched-subunit amino acid transport system ATPase component
VTACRHTRESTRQIAGADRYPEDSLRGRSSVGRALPLQGRCQGFDSPRLHPKNYLVRALKPAGRASNQGSRCTPGAQNTATYCNIVWTWTNQLDSRGGWWQGRSGGRTLWWAGREHTDRLGVLSDASTVSRMDTNGIFRFRTLTFAAGFTLVLPRNGIVVLIGPNNVGKSTALGEIASYVNNGSFVHNNRLEIVFRGAEIEVAPAEVFIPWIEEFASEIIPDVSDPLRRTFRNWGSNQQQRSQRMADALESVSERHLVASFLLCSGPMAAFDGQAPDYYSDNPMAGGQNKQFEDLYNDPSLEARISGLSQRIFGAPVALSRLGRQSVLHFGTLPPLDELPTEEQRRELRNVPKVSDQGEGVRGFLNLAMTLELGREPLVLLDEPDAHLHPPQAFAAGRFIAERGKRSQVFVVTHSLEFLHGIIDSDSSVTVVRMDRPTPTQSSVAVLAAEDLQHNWRDTAVRYSGALTGLMHRGVVLCEGDGDCRYYEVTLDHHTAGEPAHDLRFVQAGGKSGIKKLARALSAIAVPVSCVVDFDFLREWSDVRDLAAAMQTDASALEPDWRLLSEHLRQKGDPRTIEILKGELDELIRRTEADGVLRYDRPLHRQITETIKLNDGWAIAKRHGLAAARGEPFNAGGRLIDQLRMFGIHVLPFGEMESLHPEIVTHGPTFVNEVIERGLFRGLGPQQVDFIRGIRHTHRPERQQTRPSANDE